MKHLLDECDRVDLDLDHCNWRDSYYDGKLVEDLGGYDASYIERRALQSHRGYVAGYKYPWSAYHGSGDRLGMNELIFGAISSSLS